MQVGFWGEFCLACRHLRDRWIHPDRLLQALIWLLALQLCFSPLTLDIGWTMYSLGTDAMIVLLDVQMAMFLALVLTGWQYLRQRVPDIVRRW